MIATMRETLVDLPLYGSVWTPFILLALIAVVAVYETRDWRRVTRLRDQHRRRRIVVIDQNGGRRYA